MSVQRLVLSVEVDIRLIETMSYYCTTKKKFIFYKHIFPLLKVLILSIIIIIFILRNFDKPKECDFFSRFKNLCFSYFVLVLTLHKIYSKLKVNTNFVNLIFIFSFNDKILSRI